MSFSLRSLLLTIPIVALGISGFVFNLPWAASLIYTICMAVLLFAVVGALLARGQRRLFWVGFAAFGWGYWLLAFEGTVPDRIYPLASPAPLRFVTSDVIESLERFVTFSKPVGGRVLAEWRGSYWPATITSIDSGSYLVKWEDGSGQYVNSSQIKPLVQGSRQAAHSLFCLLFAVTGAAIAVSMLRDRSDDRPAPSKPAHE